MKTKTIEQLEKELEDLKASHRSQWDTYGSELCAGDMIHQEEELEKEILRLKTIKRWKEKGLLDKNNNPIPSKPVGIEQLREIKKETTNRWKESGLLDGLTGGVPDNLAEMFESKTSYIINRKNQDFNFTRAEVIKLLDEFAFFFSDNGDPDTTGKEWLDMQYPVE